MSKMVVNTDVWATQTLTFNWRVKAACFELLVAQSIKGPLALDEIQAVLREDFELWETRLKFIFSITKDGLFYNDTLVRLKISEKLPSADELIERERILNEKKKSFIDTISPFVEVYGRQVCEDFYKYWCEPNKSKTKLRWELQPTWEIKQRFTRWKKTATTFTPKKNIYPGIWAPHSDSVKDIDYEKLKNKTVVPIDNRSLGVKAAEKLNIDFNNPEQTNG